MIPSFAHSVAATSYCNTVLEHRKRFLHLLKIVGALIYRNRLRRRPVCTVVKHCHRWRRVVRGGLSWVTGRRYYLQDSLGNGAFCDSCSESARGKPQIGAQARASLSGRQ